MPTRNLFGPLRVVMKSVYRAAPDEELLTRYVLQRDGDAFTVLVERHCDSVLRVCRAVLRCEHLAQNAAQETFIALAQKAHRVRKGSLIPWLCKVASNKAKTIRRGERRSQNLIAKAKQIRAELGPDSTCERMAHGELTKWLYEGLNELPDEHRRVLELGYLQGLTQKEIAVILGEPRSTIGYWSKKGLKRLKVVLTRRGFSTAAIGLLPALLAQQAEATTPALARSVAEAALAGAEGSKTTAKIGLFGFLSYRGWAATAMVLTVCFGIGGYELIRGHDTLLVAALHPQENANPLTTKVAAKPTKDPDLEILNNKVIPNVTAAIKKITFGDLGDVRVTKVVLNEKHVTLFLHWVHGFSGKSKTAEPRIVDSGALKIQTTLEMNYDRVTGAFDLSVEDLSDHRKRIVDLEKPIILARFGQTEISIPLPALQEAKQAFEGLRAGCEKVK